MKPTDNQIKKAFEQTNIPDPSDTAKKEALQRAMDEFAKKNAATRKKNQRISRVHTSDG